MTTGETGDGMAQAPYMVTDPHRWNLEHSIIDVDSAARFRVNYETINAVFGRDFKGLPKSWWDIKGLGEFGLLGWRVWFPRISTDGEPWKGTWLNTIDPDTHALTERKIIDEDRGWNERYESRPRVTFGWFRDEVDGKGAFRFIGVYVGRNYGQTSVFQRIATRFPVIHGPAYQISDVESIDFVGAASDWPEPAGYDEGARYEVVQTRVERDRRNRELCIEARGSACAVCGFDFEEAYGELGRGFIHVHHLKPLSESDGAHEVDPARDLIPVCPNCHAMLHRQNPPIDPARLREIYRLRRR